MSHSPWTVCEVAMTAVLEPEIESDTYLISLVRGGDVDAFGRLYERHVGAARRLARVLARDPSDADDLVAETFTRVLTALRAGRGPDTAFRAYLLTTLRHALYDRTRRDRRVEYTDDLTRYERPSTPDDPLVKGLESHYAARAFARLPERWRTVLWHTEVEGESPAQIAPLLGLTPNGVAALAYRARERLRQMYLQEHIELTSSPRCHWTGTHLAGYVRAQLARRDRSKVENHLAECAQCRLLHRELTEVNSGLRGVLATLLLGSAAPGYLAQPVKAASGLLATITGGLALLWHLLIEWCADVWAFMAGLGFKLYRLPRRLVERYGPGNAAAAGGLVAAGVAGVTVFAAVLVNTDREPPPPTIAVPRPAPSVPRPSVVPVPSPSIRPPDSPPITPPLEPSPQAMTPYVAAPAIAHDPADAQLTAGEIGTLPIGVRLAESTIQTESMTMRVPLPAGITLAAPDAGDGWSCADTGEVHCTRALLEPSGRTVARLRLAVGADVTGYQGFPVTVSTGGASTGRTLRVPVAPSGLRVGYAATGPVGFGLGGNTLVACQPRPACLAQDNNEQEMSPQLPAGREPIAPTGLAQLGWSPAASGARITLPPGANVRWARLSVTTSAKDAPDFAALHGPRGGWTSLSLAGRFADVTELVRKEGGGDWWLAVNAEELPLGRGQWAGWTLTVIYDDPGAAPGELAVYHGPKPLREAQEVSVRLGDGGAVDLGLVLWDGDRALVNDSLILDGNPLGDASNAASGHNTSSLLCAFTPGECAWRTPGLDVHRHNRVTNPGGLATLRSGNDPLELGLWVLLAESS